MPPALLLTNLARGRQEDTKMNWNEILSPEIIVFLIPLAAILVGGTIAITKLIIRHRERMAMIERGIDPYHPQEPQPDEQNSTVMH